MHLWVKSSDFGLDWDLKILFWSWFWRFCFGLGLGDFGLVRVLEILFMVCVLKFCLCLGFEILSLSGFGDFVLVRL